MTRSSCALRGVDQPAVAVAEVERRVPGEHVEITAALDIGHPRAVRGGDDHGQRMVGVRAVRVGGADGVSGSRHGVSDRPSCRVKPVTRVASPSYRRSYARTQKPCRAARPLRWPVRTATGVRGTNSGGVVRARPHTGPLAWASRGTDPPSTPEEPAMSARRHPALSATDPELAVLRRGGGSAPGRDPAPDPQRELRVRGRPGSLRHGAAEQVQRGLPRPPLLRGPAEHRPASRRSAIERAKALFGVDHANVQPYSGSPANLAVYLAFAKPGDTVMGMALPMGGHLTHGWGVSRDGLVVPRRAVRRHARTPGSSTTTRCASWPSRSGPKIIFCGGTALPAHHRLRRLRGDRAGGRRDPGRRRRPHRGPDRGRRAPVPGRHADVISTTTHKTLRGPRGAMLMCREEHAKAIDKAVFPGLQGGPHNQTTAGIAVALHEAAQPSFRDVRPRGRRQREGAGRRRCWSAASTWSPAARTTT